MCDKEVPPQEAGAQHHPRRTRYGFSYRGTRRGPLFAAWVGNGKRVLDLGCRDGSLTQYYAPGNTVTGVDIDSHALSLASERLSVSGVRHDLNRQRLPFEDSSFDVVVAGEVLEHLIDPAFIVNEAYRLLALDGIFIGSVPNSFHWRARLAFLRGRSTEDPAHLHLFSLAKLRQLLHRFKIVEVLPIGGIGGHLLPILPAWLSEPAVRQLPTLFASAFLFRSSKT
jgi:2-polyprenyl-3-methyl-5-hydroxy-6-metoxy-1,4-benzoquinol methylase